MKILLANPRGFCAGVDRAIDIVEHALKLFGAPIYVRHEVVHNRYVVEQLKQKGAIFVEEIAEIPENSIAIFSAHGVSQQVRFQAKDKHLKVFDATCPLVIKVHLEVAKYSQQGKECILIGHAGHPEVEGTLGQYNNTNGAIYLVESLADVTNLTPINEHNLAFVTQTTLSVDDTAKIVAALQLRFPDIEGPKKEDICYATQNRQDAVKELVEHSDAVVVVGSQNSSNSNRLKEIAAKLGKPSFLIDNASELNKSWFDGIQTVGVTAGASAPEILVQQVITQLKTWGGKLESENNANKENVTFSLPAELKKMIEAQSLTCP